jgi:hypothetical protein
MGKTSSLSVRAGALTTVALLLAAPGAAAKASIGTRLSMSDRPRIG